jgi:hypothetical protein
MSEQINWVLKANGVPEVTPEDPNLNRQFIVDSSWGIRAAYFQHNWGVPHFQDVDQHLDEGGYHEDEAMYVNRFKVYRWAEMPTKRIYPESLPS